MPGVVGITVGEKIHAVFAGSFDDVDVFGGFAPDGDGADFDVGVFDGNVGALADGDLFFERGETFVALVADVGFVKAAMFGGDFREGDDFGGGAVAGHVVFEAGGKAERAFDSWPVRASATIF